MYDNWHNMTLAEQLGNIGSDYERALHWKRKDNQKMLEGALARALEQIDLSLSDPRWAGPRRREIARMRDEVCKEILADEINMYSAQQLQRYFMAFAVASRREKGCNPADLL
ncbi:MAG: hypothetical protein A3G57_01005 [Candidatus Andersenbacteria bacterium RIFCSPLOWO2_12_FULL_45_8]|nr:MAG: hypothetical protein UW94_C0009G0070 [Parcubacteria group bacterium GW2011_GWA2_45_14]OGY36633.1 MAG: hypothetical protein A3I08_01235 [Candidatus Andersenbacteria bacterium RIFCSPLOWO2_02_FULL_46_11]OGY40467.1 MAG: hypothetical protein A3G57_01005 [Candidatus Andersenbacteria bacterium RIFCSPLOWO2_12_FULL_45_8]HBE90394.1 hypothetical protein [Candidatus Andersenbacteria bacterium]